MTARRSFNFKHLRYFAEAARRGSVTAAARALFVTPQTVSGQIQELEASIGQPLFDRIGKRLVLTNAGETALDYANTIFALGDELGAVLRAEARPRLMTLRVGVTDSVPKLLTIATLAPVIERHRDQIELICHEGAYPELLGRVGSGQLDMVLADTPPSPALARSLHVLQLEEDAISFLAAPRIVAQLRGRFPRNLDQTPLLVDSHSLLSQALEVWFARHEVRPRIVGRIEDSALLKGFAHSGLGVAAVPVRIERDVARQYGLKVIGRTDEVRQPLYLIRARVRRAHPLVVEIEKTRRSGTSSLGASSAN